MAVDPVCGMQVDENKAEWTAEYKGETYYFCAPGCRAAFVEAPQQYTRLNSNSPSDHHHAGA